MISTTAPRGRRRHLLVAAAIYTLVTVILFRGYWMDPFHLAPAGGPDASQMIWFLRWVPFAIAHGRNPLVTTWALYPLGANLMWNTSILLPSALMAPITLSAGPVFAYDALHSLAFILSAWTAYVAIHRLTGSKAGALAGGAVYAFSPFMLGEGLGHAQLFVAVFPPLVLLLGHELACGNRPPWQPGMALGVAAAAQLLTGEELLAITALTAAIAAAIAVLMNPGTAARLAPRAAAGLAWAAVAFAPLAAVPLLVQFRGPQRPGGVLHTDVGIYHNDLLTLVVPGGLEQFDPAGLAGRFGNSLPHGGFLGVPLIAGLVLAVLAIRSRRLYGWAAIGAAVMFLLSLGDNLYIGGRSTGIPLPWRLFDHVPLLGNTLTARLVACGYLLAGVVVAGAVVEARAARGLTRALFAGLAGLSLLTLAPTLQYPVASQTAPAFFRPGGEVRRFAVGDVAVMVPFIDESPRAMMWQAIADMRYRTPSGYLFIPGPSYPILYAPPSPLRNALNSAEAGRPLTPLDSGDRAAMAGDLTAWHARAIVVGPMANQARTIAFVTALMRRPPEFTGGVYVWWDVSPAEVL